MPSARLLSSQFHYLFLASIVCVLMLSGCTAATKLVQNDDLSAEIKGKSYKNYKEVLFIPPKADPRNVVPRVVAELENMGFKVRQVDPEKPLEPGQGTGFLISSSGFMLTCAHVLEENKEATVTLNGMRYFADVVKADKDTDIALLKLRDKQPEAIVPLSFRGRSQGYNMGEDVFTIGYPLSRLLGNSARMSKGLLSATTGRRDDPKMVQVSAEIQPGNSGGPLLDHNGQIIGIIQQTMNPWFVAQSTGGALPQNINFSIKNDPALDFLKDASPSAFAEVSFDKGHGLEEAARAVAKIQGGIVKDTDRQSKMVVHLTYISRWDMWYRFRLFALSAFDFDTHERLFVVGQDHDNMISNEDVVIKDTFAQFRKAITSR